MNPRLLSCQLDLVGVTLEQTAVVSMGMQQYGPVNTGAFYYPPITPSTNSWFPALLKTWAVLTSDPAPRTGYYYAVGGGLYEQQYMPGNAWSWEGIMEGLDGQQYCGHEDAVDVVTQEVQLF